MGSALAWGLAVSEEVPMRELRVTSVDADASHVICVDAETGGSSAFPPTTGLRAAARGDVTRLGQIQIEMDSLLRPREIQARIRAGASVEEVAAEAGDRRPGRFAHPVLLERTRAAELIRASHPDARGRSGTGHARRDRGGGLRSRGLQPAVGRWDAWKGDDGNWVGQLTWTAGHTVNHAHWRYAPGSQGGTTDALDNTADELLHPGSAGRHQLQPVADPAESVTVDAQASSHPPPARRTRAGVGSRTA